MLELFEIFLWPKHFGNGAHCVFVTAMWLVLILLAIIAVTQIGELFMRNGVGAP